MIAIINNRKDFANGRKVLFYSKTLPLQQSDFYISGLSPDLAYSYISESVGEDISTSSQVLWRVLSSKEHLWSQGAAWAKIFEPFIEAHIDICAKKLYEDEDKAAQCLKYLPITLQRTLCEKYQQQHGKDKAEQLEQKLNEHKLKEQNTQPLTARPEPIGGQDTASFKDPTLGSPMAAPTAKIKTAAAKLNSTFEKRTAGEGAESPRTSPASEHNNTRVTQQQDRTPTAKPEMMVLPSPNENVNLYNLSKNIISAASDHSELLQCTADFASLPITEQSKFLISSLTKNQALIVYPLLVQTKGFSEELFASVFDQDQTIAVSMLRTAAYDEKSVLKQMTTDVIYSPSIWDLELLKKHEEEMHTINPSSSKRKLVKNRAVPTATTTQAHLDTQRPSSERGSQQTQTHISERNAKLLESEHKIKQGSHLMDHLISTKRTKPSDSDLLEQNLKQTVTLLLQQNQIEEIKYLFREKFTIQQCALALTTLDYYSGEYS